MSQRNSRSYSPSSGQQTNSAQPQARQINAEELDSLLPNPSRSAPTRSSSPSTPCHHPNTNPQQQQQQQQQQPYPSLHAPSPNAALRYRSRAIWLLAIYIPILILPWILTSIMTYRPIMKPAYVNQVGKYSVRDIWHMERWRTAVGILNGVASVLAVPTVSALLGYGAVVYTQRRHRKRDEDEIEDEDDDGDAAEKTKTANGDSLNLGQMFALADKGWSDVGVLHKALFQRGEGKIQIGSRYLWYGVVLVLLAAIQPPLRQLFVRDETITVVTCNDQPVLITNTDSTCDNSGLLTNVVGKDPEPTMLAKCPQDIVLQRTLNRIIDVRGQDTQLHLWPQYAADVVLEQGMSTFDYLYNFHPGLGTFFASSIVNGTTTGVLRQHAIRMDTEVTCVADEAFPATCPGARPFTAEFSNRVLNVAICAERSYDSVPWENTRNAQNLTERLWIHVAASPRTSWSQAAIDTVAIPDNFTLRCDATSRRAWFELGNYQNEFTYQPMLHTWPDDHAMQTQYNDFTGDLSHDRAYWPVREEPDTEENYRERTLSPVEGTFQPLTPGPLTTAALALFGNGTLLHSARTATTALNQAQAAQSICQHSRVPFYAYRGGYGDLDGLCTRTRINTNSGDSNDLNDSFLLSRFLAGFMTLFSSPSDAKELLEITAFFANEAFLTNTAERNFLSRDIYTAPGYLLIKPTVSVAGLVVISALIVLQVVGLLALAAFIYSTPCWTIALDASALARIGAQVYARTAGRGLDDFGLGGSGIVGVGEKEIERHTLTGGEAQGLVRGTVKVLGIGEPGVISRAELKVKFG